MKRVAAGLALLVAANACSAPPSTVPPTAGCPNLTAGPWRRLDTVRIGLTSAGPADPAPNAGLEIAARAGHQPLVWYDCAGQLVGGAAERWSHTGSDWTFELKPQYSADSAQSLWLAGADVVLTGPRRIRVATTAAGELAPALTRPRFPIPGRQVWAIPALPDPRDLITANRAESVDLLVTRDREVADYARTRPEWTVEPLPYDRFYVLALPDSEVPAFDVGDLIAATRADVRAPGRPVWFAQTGCETLPPPPARTQQPGVLYPAGDPVAQALAERIVALALRSGAASRSGLTRLTRAVAADAAMIRGAIDGRSAAAVVADPAGSVGCDVPRWSRHAGSRVALLETRAFLIARRDVGPLARDRDGWIWLLASRRP